MIGRRDLLTGTAALCGLGATKIAATEKPNMPFMTITASGVYAITSDYTATSATDDAIVVASGVHNVTILLYSRLEAGGPTSRTNSGVLLNGNNAVRIIGMGGWIRGFGFGVRGSGCDGLSVSNLDIPDALVRGIKNEGDGAYLDGNKIGNVFGSTWTPNQYCMGIDVSGAAPTIINNTVRDFRGTGNGEGVGIAVADQAVGGLVKGNACMASLVDGVPRPKTIAYWVGGASNVDFVHNHGANCNWGLAASSPTMGLFDENSFRNCTTPFVEDDGDWLVGGIDG